MESYLGVSLTRPLELTPLSPQPLSSINSTTKFWGLDLAAEAAPALAARRHTRGRIMIERLSG